VILEGSPASGHSLKAVVAGWEPDVLVTFQWLRNGTEIAGATQLKYVLTSEDGGQNVSVRITGTQLHGEDDPR